MKMFVILMSIVSLRTFAGAPDEPRVTPMPEASVTILGELKSGLRYGYVEKGSVKIFVTEVGVSAKYFSAKGECQNFLLTCPSTIEIESYLKRKDPNLSDRDLLDETLRYQSACRSVRDLKQAGRYAGQCYFSAMTKYTDDLIKASSGSSQMLLDLNGQIVSPSFYTGPGQMSSQGNGEIQCQKQRSTPRQPYVYKCESSLGAIRNIFYINTADLVR